MQSTRQIIGTLGLFISATLVADPISLFDGKTLKGWEGDPTIWRVDLTNECIVGGSTERTQKQNVFLVTTESYENFELTFEVRMHTGGGFANSGLQFRSERVPNSDEMSGYQADIGTEWWGKLYDESRRNKVLAGPKKAFVPILDNQWNYYRIVASGGRLQAWVNEQPGFDYTELDSAIPRSGRIGLQLHGGGKTQVEFRNLKLKPLASSGPKVPKQAKPKPSPLTAEEQKETFTLPPGYEIELVATESADTGKFITVDWDQQGRMWTMTALEYPVDGNESPAVAAALYASRARDKVLVFDRSDTGIVGKPRVFTEGLAIPTGLLPMGNGDTAIVHHGEDIVQLTDSDGDGRADKRKVLLSGFGVQDSHLMPHQFTRAPGGWIWLAQGAFNYGKVKGADGTVTKFDQTRMAKFKPDGSNFDITSNGPCNIWGLALTEEGDCWIQEANDYGFPAMPFHEYANYPGCSNSQWPSYAPEFPGTATDFRMGGSGLSGLAIADRGRWPTEAENLLWVANPIVGSVQSVRVTREGEGFRYERGFDLVTSSDPWFRPIAVKAGPDGCLYIVDWYNKIISHNEVPRNHPERDKSRGRIWRVRHRDFTPLSVPDFTKVAPQELVKMLGTESSTRTHLAWQTIVDRQYNILEPVLRTMVVNRGRTPAQRIPALWALEGLGLRDAALVRTLLTDPSRNIRREALRTLNEYADSDSAQVIALAAVCAEDPDATVRQEVIKLAGRRISKAPNEALELLLRMIKPVIDVPLAPSTQNAKRKIPVGAAYDRLFERYLIRLHLERQQGELAKWLTVERLADINPEAALWMVQALPPVKAGVYVPRILSKLDRAPNKEELVTLLKAANNPEAFDVFKAALVNEKSQEAVALALIDYKSNLDPLKVAPLIVPAAREMLPRGGTPTALATALAEAFALSDLESDLAAVLDKSKKVEESVAVLKALASFRGGDPAVFMNYTADSSANVRREALTALAVCKKPEASNLLLGLWPKLNAAMRAHVIEQWVRTKEGSLSLVEALSKDKISLADLDAKAIERLQVQLAGNSLLNDLLKKLGDKVATIATFDGSDNAHFTLPVKLEGAYTFETWFKASAGITNADGLFGLSGIIDVNLAASIPRIYLYPPLGDVVIARRPVSEGHWVHLAVVRDDKGHYSLYVNGELEGASAQTDLRIVDRPQIGWSTAAGGLAGQISDIRVWQRARTAAEIRASFDRRFAATAKPDGLIYATRGSEGWATLPKSVQLTMTSDGPRILSAEEATKLDASFTRLGALAKTPGSLTQGKAFAAVCQTCHLIRGEGHSLGPDLSAIGAMGIDAILRNILTPNAVYEPGYRVYRAETVKGALIEGFLVSDKPDAIVIRAPGGYETRIAREDIVKSGFLERSIMPAGLLDGFSDEQARDLLAYLQSLK